MEGGLIGLLLGRRRSADGARGGDGDGGLQGETQEGFGGNLDLLTARDAVDSGARTGSGHGSDGRAFSATGHSSDNRAKGSAAADFLRGTFAASLALFGPGVSDDLDVAVGKVNADELNGEERRALEMGGVLNVGDAAEDRRSLGDGDHVGDDDVLGQRGVKAHAGRGGCAGEVFNNADGEHGSGGEGEGFFDRLGGRRRRCRRSDLRRWRLLRSGGRRWRRNRRRAFHPITPTLVVLEAWVLRKGGGLFRLRQRRRGGGLLTG